jgi:hypothetical protein
VPSTCEIIVGFQGQSTGCSSTRVNSEGLIYSGGTNVGCP